MSKLLKRSNFYGLNGITPPPFKIQIPKEEIPKKINNPLIENPNSVKGQVTKILEDWLMISSEAFSDKGKFPDIYLSDLNKSIKIKIDDMKFRVNDAHNKFQDEKENLPSDKN